MKYINIHFVKPLYEHNGRYFINLWEKHVQKAKKTKKKLKIEVPGKGVGIYTASEWLKGAEYSEKVFKRPDEPMVLVGNFWEKGHGLEDTAEVKRLVEDYTIPDSIRLRLRDEAKRMGII